MRAAGLAESPADGPCVLTALAAGDEPAWQETVGRYEKLVRSRARAVLRGEADVDEAVQRTWVLLLGHAHRINDCARLPGWLATTARREALAILRAQQRTIPSPDVSEHVGADERDLAAALIERELAAALDEAVERLPESQRQVVRALLRGPLSYDQLSRELAMPRGSLGPLRGRAIRTLRAHLGPILR